MSIISKTTIKTNFESGDHPTQSQFADLIDSASVPLASDLTYSGTVATDASISNVYRLVLTGAVILSNPTNAIDGQVISWEIKQGAGAPHAITLDTKFLIPTSATNPLSFSTTLNYMDMLVVRYNASSDKFFVISMIPGYSL
jgi:hypothetical protein